MKLVSEVIAEVNPAAIAKVLYTATPEEFARVWLTLSQLNPTDEAKHGWAESLSQQLGASGRHLIEELLRISTFYRVSRDIPPEKVADELASKLADAPA